MNTERIATLEQLRHIPITENDDAFVSLTGVSGILCHYEKTDMRVYLGDTIIVRKGVAERLTRAAVNLVSIQPNAVLRVTYGYRHPRVQEQYHTTQIERLRVLHPTIADDELQKRAHLFSAQPDVAGHPTGGAIDITIRAGEHDLDMGTTIADFSNGNRIRTYADGLTPEQRRNRTILRSLLVQQGFAPFDGEWWHFSYGDREWAAYYKQPHALYSQHELSPETCARFNEKAVR